MIPTAEEFLKKEELVTYIKGQKAWLSNVKSYMIEFAKLHVEAALKIASEKATTTVHKHIHDKDEIDGYILIEIINKDSILNAYPLENIK